MYKFILNSTNISFKILILIILCVIKFDFNFQLIRSIGRDLKVSWGRLINLNSSCYLPIIKEVPENSTIIIGHAYGSHKKNNKSNIDFIAPKISAFLNDNEYLIKDVIFSGDVFKIPSITKWQKLLSLYENKFKIIIAPGNHDISGNQNYSYKYKDIFSKLILDLSSYPFTYRSNGFNLIIENSVERINLNNNKIYQIIRNQENDHQNKILIRHHIPIRELSYLSNEKLNLNKLPTHSELEENIKNSIIISGDGGAFKHLPSISCNKYGSNTFIVNGIGQKSEDRIIILSKTKLFQMKVK